MMISHLFFYLLHFIVECLLIEAQACKSCTLNLFEGWFSIYHEIASLLSQLPYIDKSDHLRARKTQTHSLS